VLQAIVDLPIPRLADACLVDALGDNDVLERVASTRQRESLTPALRALASRPLDWDSPSPIVDAVRRRRRELAPVVDDEWLEANEEPALVEHWRALGAHAMLTLPLVAGDHVFGAITLIATDPLRSFAEDQRALAEKFAAVAATIWKARLYGLAQPRIARATRCWASYRTIPQSDQRRGDVRRVLEEPPQKDAERAELLRTIRESAEWANRLIQDLLDVASIERGQLSLQLREQDPAQMVLQALHMFEVEAQQHGITLTASVPTNLPLVMADNVRIIQVLGNLLRNAVKFTPRDGRIVVSAEERDRSLVLSVRDTGAGIASEHLDRIFDRYWQSADGSRARGTGLGLAISNNIVDAHGGKIWVESRSARKYLSFSVPRAVAGNHAGNRGAMGRANRPEFFEPSREDAMTLGRHLPDDWRSRFTIAWTSSRFRTLRRRLSVGRTARHEVDDAAASPWVAFEVDEIDGR
jgi:signal transduction histidine kinase